MKIYSNMPIPDTLKWKDNQVLVAINKKENAYTPETEGQRYEADFTIAEKADVEAILQAFTRQQNDVALDNAVIYNFEINGIKAIDIKNTYAVKAQTSIFKPLPTSGRLLKGEIYSYNNGAVMVVQDHDRTIYAPELTPALFSFYREITEGKEWIAGEQIALNATRTYNGKTYKCLQAHQSQDSWNPEATLGTLWSVVVTSSAWAVGVAYKVNDVVTYSGKSYKCLQAHTSQAGWMPSAVPALWKLI